MSSPGEIIAKLVEKCLIYEGVPVKCAGCGGWFHELTAKYDPDGPLRGSYLRLTSRYREYGWYDFPHEDWVVGDNVMCPQCMMPYRPGVVMAQVLIWAEKQEMSANESRQAAGEEVDARADARAEAPEEGGNDSPPEAVGDLAVPGVVGVGSDDAGLPASGDNGDGVTDVADLVRKMSWDGATQAEIAKTCGISVYMVREIQNGRKV
jgi:hypothetical protein